METPFLKSDSGIETWCESGSEPAGRPLTEAEQQYACERLYGFMQRLLRARLGRGAVEHAGLALVGALRTYDGQTPLRAWVVKKGLWIARFEYRTFHGRPGLQKRPANLPEVTYLENDLPHVIDRSELPSPCEIAQQRDGLRRVLAKTEQLDDLPRLVALGRLIGGYDHADIANMLEISPRTAHRQLAHVRRSVFVD